MYLQETNIPQRRSIIFKGPVVINNLEAGHINNYNFQKLFDTLFYRTWQQNVTAVHKIKKLRTSKCIQLNLIYNEIKSKSQIKIVFPIMEFYYILIRRKFVCTTNK